MHTKFLTPALILTLAIIQTTKADTYTWSGSDGNFSNPASWSGPAPTFNGSPTDQLLFAAYAIQTATVDSSGPWLLNSLSIEPYDFIPLEYTFTLTGLPNASLSFQGPNPTIYAYAIDFIPANIALPITADTQLTIAGNSLLLTAPLSFTGQNTQLNINTNLTYQSNTTPSNLIQANLKNASLTWSYTPTTTAPIALSFGSGPINLNSSYFTLNILPDPSSPSPQIDITNPFNIIGESQLGTSYVQPYGTIPSLITLPPPNTATIRYTGPIHLNGELDLSAQTNTIIAGDITLDQSSGVQPIIAAAGDFYKSTISGNIIDDPAHTGSQPLWLQTWGGLPINHGFIIAGKNNTYSTGTIINGDNISVTPDSRLGTGPVTIQYGTLHLSAPANIAPNQKVLIASLGSLAIAFDADPSSLIDPASSGGLALDINFSTPLNLATLGNGRMFLGSVNNSIYTAPSLAPGLDNTYRLATPYTSAGSDSAFLTLQHSILIDYNNTPTSAQLGGVILPVSNSYSGNTTIIGPVHADAPGALGTGNLTVGLDSNSYCTLSLSAPNTYAPTAKVDVLGTLAAIGPNGSIPLTTTAPILHPGSTLTLGDNINNNSNRYPDSMALALHNSALQINATGITTESIGPFSFTGLSTLTFQNPVSGNHATTLLTPSISHPTNAILFITLLNASFDPAAPSYANLLAATAPTVINNMLSPSFQSRATIQNNDNDPATSSSFLTYTPTGFAPVTYTTFPTTSGTSTEIVDLTPSSFNIYRPIPGSPIIFTTGTFQPAGITSVLITGSQTQLSPNDPSLSDLLTRLILDREGFFILNQPSVPPPPPNNMFAPTTDASLYALRTSIDIHNPDSGPVTLHLASGGLILASTHSGLLIEPNLNFDNAQALINTDAPGPTSNTNTLSGQIIAAHGLTKVGPGSLTLTNPNNILTGPLSILEGQLTLPSLPTNSTDPIIITSLASLQFTNSVTLTRPIHFFNTGTPTAYHGYSPASIVSYNNSLTIAAPITGNAYSTLGADTLTINAPITLTNNLELGGNTIHLNANISVTHLYLSGNITGNATITTPNGTDFEGPHLSPGNNPGDFATITIIAPNASNGGFFINAGSALDFDLDASGHSDHLLIDGSLLLYPNGGDYSSSLNLNFLAPPTGQIYTLLSYSSITGTFSTITGLPANYSLDYTPTSILLIPNSPLSNAATPEPASLFLLTLTLPLILRRRPHTKESK